MLKNGVEEATQKCVVNVVGYIEVWGSKNWEG
jgi:hypothetical protein